MENRQKLYPDKAVICMYYGLTDKELTQYWPGDILSMVGAELPKDSCMKKALSILFQFRKIDSSLLANKRNDLKKSIREHLLEFGRGLNPNPYNTTARSVEQVCKIATPLLENQQQVLSKSRGAFSKFERRWLTNAPLLLPEDSECVIPALPFLLSCYTMSISNNKSDPYDDDPISGGYSGWTDIFRALKGLDSQMYKDEGGGNRSRAITNLCDHFVLPPNYKCFAFCYDNDPEQKPICNTRSARTKRKKQDIKSLTNAESMKKCFECWEYYRQFACFCNACENIKGVNITLSTALFASLWDLSSICRAGCKDPICDDCSSPTCDRPKLPPYTGRYCSTYDLNEDKHRKRILEALTFCDGKEPTIQTYVTDLWFRATWDYLSADALERLYTDT